MYLKRLSIFCCCLLVLGGWQTASAGSPKDESVQLGLRASFISDNKDEDFDQFELVYSRPLSWTWPENLSSRLDITLGYMSAGGDDGYLLSVGPSFWSNKYWGGTSFGFGISPTLLSESRFGDENLGGQFHFTSFVGVKYDTSKNTNLGLRLQHLSNGGLDDDNPGLNLVILEFRYLLEQPSSGLIESQ